MASNRHHGDIVLLPKLLCRLSNRRCRFGRQLFGTLEPEQLAALIRRLDHPVRVERELRRLAPNETRSSRKPPRSSPPAAARRLARSRFHRQGDRCPAFAALTQPSAANVRRQRRGKSAVRTPRQPLVQPSEQLCRVLRILAQPGNSAHQHGDQHRRRAIPCPPHRQPQSAARPRSPAKSGRSPHPPAVPVRKPSPP